jgi:hypothetical protein
MFEPLSHNDALRRGGMEIYVKSASVATSRMRSRAES